VCCWPAKEFFALFIFWQINISFYKYLIWVVKFWLFTICSLCVTELSGTQMQHCAGRRGWRWYEQLGAWRTYCSTQLPESSWVTFRGKAEYRIAGAASGVRATQGKGCSLISKPEGPNSGCHWFPRHSQGGHQRRYKFFDYPILGPSCKKDLL
jgi:hypothetical protein